LSLPGNSTKILIEFRPAQKNTEFQNLRIKYKVLNATAIASDYAGHDPQAGICDGSVL